MDVHSSPAGGTPVPDAGADDPGVLEPSVVVIGDGAAGTLVVIGLLRSATRHRVPLRVSWVGDGEPGRGVAYSTPSPWHRLNVPSAQMCQGGPPGGFPGWLAARGSDDPDGYAARWDFGSYLNDVLADARDAARSLVTLEQVRRRAVSVSVGSRSVRVGLDDDTQVSAGRAVLAVGLFPPAPLPGLTSAAAGHPGLVADPWNGALERVAGTGDAVLIGTGLTMVDVALSLSRQAPGLRLHAVSRNGLTPRAHEAAKADPAPAVVRPHPGLTLSELVTGVEDAVAEAPPRWREVVDGLRRVTQDLWRSLSDGDRKEFLRAHARRWEVHRHRMAPDVGQEFETLVDEGRLRTSASAVQAIDVPDSPDGRLLVRLRDNDLDADWVINCTGPRADVTAVGDPLVGSLLSAGHARPHPLGLGFDTTTHGALLSSDGPSERLFTLGSPRRGELYETTAIREISDQAGELADLLLAAETSPTREYTHDHQQKHAAPALTDHPTRCSDPA